MATGLCILALITTKSALQGSVLAGFFSLLFNFDCLFRNRFPIFLVTDETDVVLASVDG
jgi:hypothetical protein